MRYNRNFLLKNKNNNNNKNDKSNTSIKASNRTCNLIGKMINGVGKSTISGLGHNKQNDKTIKTTKTTTTDDCGKITTTSGANTGTEILTKYTYNFSKGGNTIAYDELVVNDFHNNNDNDSDNNKYYYRNCSLSAEQSYKITNLNELSRENLSLVNETTTKTTTTTIVELITKQQQQQEQFMREEAKGESLITVKPPSSLFLQNFDKRRSRHKNITIIPRNDSYQRAVDQETFNAKEHNYKCELLAFNSLSDKHPQKDYETVSELKFQTLAERKAWLKKEFFKDLNKGFNNTTTTTTSATAATTNIVKLKLSNQTLNKRILKNKHNLKLRIPRDCNKLRQPQQQSQSQPGESITVSLVALRKLDLQKKQQTSLKSVAKSFHNTLFPRVKELAKKFDLKDTMILPQTNNKATEAKSCKVVARAERQSPLSDEGCNIGQSPYSSDDDDNDSIRTTNTAIQRIPANKPKDKVARSASSDSALGLEVDEPMDIIEQQQQQQLHQQKRRMTLTVTDLPLRPALLPLAEPTLLPDSPTIETPTLPPHLVNLQQNQIPSKVLLEERVIEIPEDPRSGFSSRRESSQSCFSDFPPGEMQGVRFVRTPSVVVSDYSDDITCGITLEEIEYFRAQRLRRRRSSLENSGNEKDALDNSSDISASSSCSNLYYCGSTISALDGAECLVNGVRQQLERKSSDCSTCSVSGDEDNINNTAFCIPEQPEDCQDITDMLANQHLTSKRSKKVGKAAANFLTLDTKNV